MGLRIFSTDSYMICRIIKRNIGEKQFTQRLSKNTGKPACCRQAHKPNSVIPLLPGYAAIYLMQPTPQCISKRDSGEQPCYSVKTELTLLYVVLHRMGFILHHAVACVNGGLLPRLFTFSFLGITPACSRQVLYQGR